MCHIINGYDYKGIKTIKNFWMKKNFWAAKIGVRRYALGV